MCSLGRYDLAASIPRAAPSEVSEAQIICRCELIDSVDVVPNACDSDCGWLFAVCDTLINVLVLEKIDISGYTNKHWHSYFKQNLSSLRCFNFPVLECSWDAD